MDKKYLCPKHGEIGNIHCSICWEKLELFLKDKNVYLTGDLPEGMKHG